MSIEFTIQSVTLQPEDIQEKFPGLVFELGQYLPTQKKTKRRRRKRKKGITVGSLIKEIIDSIEE